MFTGILGVSGLSQQSGFSNLSGLLESLSQLSAATVEPKGGCLMLTQSARRRCHDGKIRAWRPGQFIISAVRAMANELSLAPSAATGAGHMALPDL